MVAAEHSATGQGGHKVREQGERARARKSVRERERESESACERGGCGGGRQERERSGLLNTAKRKPKLNPRLNPELNTELCMQIAGGREHPQGRRSQQALEQALQHTQEQALHTHPQGRRSCSQQALDCMCERLRVFIEEALGFRVQGLGS